MAWDRSRQRLQVSAMLLAACAFASGAPVWAQDVAEAARQAQAAKDKQGAGLKHVYTDEDLKRKKILTPEDRQLLDAKKREQAIPGSEVAPTDLDAQALDQLPLGDVARMYRAMKELQMQTGAPTEYHLGVVGGALASPEVMPKVTPEFVMPRPNVFQPENRTTPTAPEFADATSTASAPKAQHEFAMPRPRNAHRTTRHEAIAPVFANAAGTMPVANSDVVIAKPSEVQPAARTEAIAPVSAHSSIVPMKGATAYVMPKPREVQPTAGSAPIAPVFPNFNAPRTVVVQRGDTMWKLAEVNMGDGRRWRELAAVNPSISDPKHIVPGTVINLAENAPVVPAAPAAPSDSNITIRKGDSLWKIAKLKLGAGGFWGCIAKANPRIIDANRIYAGDVLTLPTDCESNTTK